MKFKEEASKIFEGHKPEGAHTRTYITQIIQDISKVPGFKRLDSWTLGDGMTALYHYKDGNAYEFIIRPAKYGQYKDLFGNVLKKREDRIEPDKEEVDEIFGLKKKEPEQPKNSYQRLQDMNATIWPVMKKKGFKDRVRLSLKESGVGDVPPAVPNVGNIAYGMTVDEDDDVDRYWIEQSDDSKWYKVMVASKTAWSKGISSGMAMARFKSESEARAYIEKLKNAKKLEENKNE